MDDENLNQDTGTDTGNDGTGAGTDANGTETDTGADAGDVTGNETGTGNGTVSPTALELMKARLNRLAADTSLDIYFQARLSAARGYLEGIGIHLTDSAEDLMLLVDYAVWEYQNRDKPGGMPDWLRLKRRERWLRETAKTAGCTCETGTETGTGAGNGTGTDTNGAETGETGGGGGG